MPETLRGEFLAGRHPVVVAGTHGKTTTAALTAWVLASAGREPGYLIGGEPLNFPSPAAIGRGEAFVVEGDEYSTSYADKGPKFLHYAPRTFVLTSVEFDHADLYADLSEVKAAFAKGLALVPNDGLIVASGDDPNVLEILPAARTRTRLYRVAGDAASGPESGPDPDYTAVEVAESAHGTSFLVLEEGRRLLQARSPLAGRHNVANALAAIAVARDFRLSPEEIARGLESFRGVKRRLEVRGEAAGVTVLDDFAHHPTAVATTVAGAKKRWPSSRLVAAFEPRSMTASRADFAPAYRDALREADVVALAAPYHAARLSREGGPGALDVDALAASLRQDGVEAFTAPDAEGLAAALLARLKEGDVVLTMSSGSFGGLPGKLLERLSERASAR